MEVGSSEGLIDRTHGCGERRQERNIRGLTRNIFPGLQRLKGDFTSVLSFLRGRPP